MKLNSVLSVLKDIDPDYNEDDIPSTGWIDTGSYALNALMSASILGGASDNRITMFAGEFSTGKTYFLLGIVKKWMEKHEIGENVYYDTEYALSKTQVASRGIDPSRFHLIEKPETIEEFRTHSVNLMKGYRESDEKSRRPLLLALDSLGNLPTQKELADALSGSDKRDFTKPTVVRSFFRVIRPFLAVTRVGLLIANHTYDQMDQYKPKAVSGGGGATYNPGTIIMLSKSKMKDGDDVVGSIITAKTYKSRFSKENQEVDLALNYSTGLDRYYGLLPLAAKYGIFKKLSTQYEMPDGSKHFEKHINKDPEKYFTPEILERIEEAANKEFGLGV